MQIEILYSFFIFMSGRVRYSRVLARLTFSLALMKTGINKIKTGRFLLFLRLCTGRAGLSINFETVHRFWLRDIVGLIRTL